MDSPAYQGTILAALMPLEALFRNVKIVLTDGAPYFPDVIHELCPQTVHQLCLIHKSGIYLNFSNLLNNNIAKGVDRSLKPENPLI